MLIQPSRADESPAESLPVDVVAVAEMKSNANDIGKSFPRKLGALAWLCGDTGRVRARTKVPGPAKCNLLLWLSTASTHFDHDGKSLYLVRDVGCRVPLSQGRCFDWVSRNDSFASTSMLRSRHCNTFSTHCWFRGVDGFSSNLAIACKEVATDWPLPWQNGTRHVLETLRQVQFFGGFGISLVHCFWAD